MKHLTILLASALSIGNFVSVADACAMAPARAGGTRPPFVRISKRTLDRHVRATWRHIESKTKGF